MQIINESEPKIDRITANLAYVDFLYDVPVSKTISGEETFAEQHMGTQYASRSTGKPIFVLYSPREDKFMIKNGHHRVAEAKARDETHIKGYVSILNDERGFGAFTLKELEKEGLYVA